MKTIGVFLSKDSQDPTGMNYLVWPDSSLIHSGKPVFLPEEGNRYIMLGVGAHIDAVGKSIKSKFARRYYKEMVPVAFVLPEEAVEKIQRRENPSICDIVTDYCVISGKPFGADEEEYPLGMNIKVESLALYEPDDSEKEEYIFGFKNICGAVDEAIVTASRKNTLKTGDIVAYIIPGRYEAVPDTLFRVSVNGEVLIENKLK